MDHSIISSQDNLSTKKSLLCSGCAVKCAVEVEQASSGCISEDCHLKETTEASQCPQSTFGTDEERNYNLRKVHIYKQNAKYSHR